MKENRVTDIVSSEDEVIKKLSSILQDRANEAIESKGRFNVGLSGGSLVGLLVRGLPNVKTSWEKWVFFFCDERVVSPEDADSTFGVYRDKLIGTVPIDEDQFVVINHHLPAKEAAECYEEQLRNFFPSVQYPRFDVLLLGMGPDGHTCSLFPGHKALEAKSWITHVTDSPKPPPCRVTMTVPVLNSSALCVFPVVGSGKASMIKSILKDDADLPANKVYPENGKVIWLLDQSAASLLKD